MWIITNVFGGFWVDVIPLLSERDGGHELRYVNSGTCGLETRSPKLYRGT